MEDVGDKRLFNARSADRGVSLFSVILLCTNSSFSYEKWVANHL